MNYINKKQIQDAIKHAKLERYSEEIERDIESKIADRLNEVLTSYRKKSRLNKIDDKKVKTKALDVLSPSQVKKLPLWVKKVIRDSYVIGKSCNMVLTPDGQKYHVKNILNDLPGSRWTYFLRSVINTRYSTAGKDSYAHHIRKIHPSPKPPQLMRDIIEFFTKKNEIVLDFFMGVGGGLLGASLANRRAIGIDLCKEYVEAYKKANKELELKEQDTLCGDSLEILRDGKKIQRLLNGKQVSLIVIDPPYGNMMAREKTGQAVKDKDDNSPTPFTNHKNDLGNMLLDVFFEKLRESVILASNFLKDKGYLIVFIKDIQPNGKELNLLHSEVIYKFNEIENLYYLGTKIWVDESVNLYPYGYPFSYVANQIHQYILIFRKG